LADDFFSQLEIALSGSKTDQDDGLFSGNASRIGTFKPHKVGQKRPQRRMPGQVFLQKEKLWLTLKLNDCLLKGLDDASKIGGGLAVLDNYQLEFGNSPSEVIEDGR
jgi:hypothetical protein